MIFHQLLERLEWMFTKKYIHRDIKPDNMMMGMGFESNIVHMIDFGLTHRYIDQKSGEHIPLTTNKNLIGTCRYVSLNSHRGVELSRRDDLITLGYVMISLFKGSLPWQDIRADRPQERYLRVEKAKMACSNSELCEGCPQEFEIYLDYVMALQFTEEPNFVIMKKLVVSAAVAAEVDIFDNIFDWSLLLSQPNSLVNPLAHQVSQSWWQ